MRKNIISILLATILIAMIFAFDGWRIVLGEAPRTYTWQKIWSASAGTDKKSEAVCAPKDAEESVPCSGLLGLVDPNIFVALCPNTSLEFQNNESSLSELK